MDINEIRPGNFIRINARIAEVMKTFDGSEISYRLLRGTTEKVTDKSATSPIFLERKMLASCCGFDHSGRLKVSINSRDFFLQEKEGHIILMEGHYVPLIHFWELRALHQLQNFYYRFKCEQMPVDISKLVVDGE